MKKEKKKAEPSDDSHEDDESSVIQSAKTSTRLNAVLRSTKSGTNNNSVIYRLKQNNILAIKNSVNDANNNKTLKVRTEFAWYYIAFNSIWELRHPASTLMLD